MVAILAPADLPDSDILSGRTLPPAHIFRVPTAAPIQSEAPMPVYSNAVARAVSSAHAKAVGSDELHILEAEVSKGRAIDPRVSAEQALAFAELYRQAQVEFFRSVHSPDHRVSNRVLLATTARVVDYKVEGNAVSALIAELRREGRERELLASIDKGFAAVNPGKVPEGDIQDPVHLVSEMVRWSAEHGNQKHRLRAAAPLRAWIKEVLQQSGVGLDPRLGGISAVDTLQGKALGDQTTMMTLGSVPDDVRHFLPPHTAVVGDRPEWKALRDIPSEGRTAGHFCIFQNPKESILPHSFNSVVVNGNEVPRSALNKLDILVTGMSTVIGFGDLPAERIREIGRDHDLVVLSGAQNLKSSKDVREYFSALSTIAETGTPLALCYSEPKHKGIEMEIWKALRQSNAVQFVGLNTGEASELLERIYHALTHGNPLELSAGTIKKMESALKLLGEKSTSFGPGHETPQWLYRCATTLQEILQVPAVRVRGRESDVLILAEGLEPENPEHLRRSMIISRHLGTLKVATPEGLITEQRKLAYFRNPPVGRALAALHQIADEARVEGGAFEDAAALTSKGYVTLADGRKCFAIPPLPFFVHDGGTQSAGDTMDYSFASRETWNLLHRSRFAAAKAPLAL